MRWLNCLLGPLGHARCVGALCCGVFALGVPACIRRRPAYRHHVWAYDFLIARTQDGRPLKILTVIEEYSRECLAIVVARHLRALGVLETLAELFVTHGVLAHLRSDNGPEFTATVMRQWLAALTVERCSSSRGVPGRTGMSSRSTESCATNYSTARSSTR